LKVSKPILVALIVSILFSVYLVFFTGKKKTLPPATYTATAPSTNIQSVGQESGVQQMAAPAKLVKTDFTWKRDPFFIMQPPKENISEPKLQLKLSAILEGKKGRFAIINNEIVKTGDVIGGERVQEIGRDSVVLIKKGAKRTIPIEETFKEDSMKYKGREGEK
jgi:type II secretory pathway component PulC